MSIIQVFIPLHSKLSGCSSIHVQPFGFALNIIFESQGYLVYFVICACADRRGPVPTRKSQGTLCSLRTTGTDHPQEAIESVRKGLYGPLCNIWDPQSQVAKYQDGPASRSNLPLKGGPYGPFWNIWWLKVFRTLPPPPPLSLDGIFWIPAWCVWLLVDSILGLWRWLDIWRNLVHTYIIQSNKPTVSDNFENWMLLMKLVYF